MVVLKADLKVRHSAGLRAFHLAAHSVAHLAECLGSQWAVRWVVHLAVLMACLKAGSMGVTTAALTVKHWVESSAGR